MLCAIGRRAGAGAGAVRPGAAACVVRGAGATWISTRPISMVTSGGAAGAEGRTAAGGPGATDGRGPGAGGEAASTGAGTERAAGAMAATGGPARGGAKIRRGRCRGRRGRCRGRRGRRCGRRGRRRNSGRRWPRDACLGRGNRHAQDEGWRIFRPRHGRDAGPHGRRVRPDGPARWHRDARCRWRLRLRGWPQRRRWGRGRPRHRRRHRRHGPRHRRPGLRRERRGGRWRRDVPAMSPFRRSCMSGCFAMPEGCPCGNYTFPTALHQDDLLEVNQKDTFRYVVTPAQCSGTVVVCVHSTRVLKLPLSKGLGFEPVTMRCRRSSTRQRSRSVARAMPDRGIV